MLILEKSPMELKSIIGKRMTENGQEVRMNSIALSEIKHVLNQKGVDSLIKKLSLKILFGDEYTNDSLVRNVVHNMFKEDVGSIDLRGIKMSFTLDGYRTDDYFGICMDGDVNCIRLIKDDGKVIKRKIGRCVREYLDGNETLCEAAMNWICDQIAQKWKAYASEYALKRYTLVVDYDFRAIYDSYKQVGNFHSCMNDKDCVEFYETIKAKAASLRDDDDKIVARCIVFEECFDDDGNVYRVAERQYSTDTDLTLQQILVNKLYEGGYIDLNKRVGASCWDAQDLVDKDGKPFERNRLYIEANLKDGDYCPFMDGFAWYDECECRIYNHSSCGQELHETSGYYGYDYHCGHCGAGIREDDERYSEYHEMTLCDDCAVWSERIQDYLLYDSAVRVYDLNGGYDYMPDDWNEHNSSNNFTEVDGRFYWDEDIVYCEYDNEYHLPDDVCWDDLNDMHIPYDASVEYKCASRRWGWSERRTLEDEIGERIVEIDGEYYLMDDVVEYNGRYYLPEDCIEYDDELMPADAVLCEMYAA